MTKGPFGRMRIVTSAMDFLPDESVRWQVRQTGNLPDAALIVPYCGPAV